MSLKRIAGSCAVMCLTGAALLTASSSAFGWFWGCSDCGHERCPPPYVHCFEGPPRIKFHHGCPKPVCGPCELEHWGYYQNCWHPWPFPPDWRHCPVPPPSEVLQAQPQVMEVQNPGAARLPAATLPAR